MIWNTRIPQLCLEFMHLHVSTDSTACIWIPIIIRWDSHDPLGPFSAGMAAAQSAWGPARCHSSGAGESDDRLGVSIGVGRGHGGDSASWWESCSRFFLRTLIHVSLGPLKKTCTEKNLEET